MLMNQNTHSEIHRIFTHCLVLQNLNEIILIFFFFPFSAASVVYGGSWARDQVQAAAVT